MSTSLQAWLFAFLRWGPAWVLAFLLMEAGGASMLWAQIFMFPMMLIWFPMMIWAFWRPGSRLHHHALEQAYIDAFLPVSLITAAGAILNIALTGFDSLKGSAYSAASILLLMLIARDRALLVPVLRHNHPRKASADSE
jgi:hypothetical protein